MKEFNTALELSQTNLQKANIYYAMTEYHYYHGNYKEWEECYRKAQKLDPENPHFHNNFAARLLDLGRCEETYDEAIEALKIAEFGMAHINRKKASDCLAERENWGELPQEYSEAMFLSWSRFDKKRAKLLKAAIKKNPRYQVAKLELAYIEINKFKKPGAIKKAIKTAKKMLKEDPQSKYAHLICYRAYLAEEKYDKALQEVLAIADNPPAHYDEGYVYRALAKCYEKLNKPDEAIKQYRVLMELNPRSEEYYKKKIRELRIKKMEQYD